MKRRTFAKSLLGAFIASPVLPTPEPEIPVLLFEMDQKVRWLRPPTNMPTIGHVIGVQQRRKGTELEETRYHVDFETLSGGTKLWIGAHELEPVGSSQERLDMLRAYEEMERT